MGSSQSKIRGTSVLQEDSAKIKDFLKSSFSSLCHIDSIETLALQSNDSDAVVEAPNRFTLKAVLKNPTVDSGCGSDSPQSSTSDFQLDDLDKIPSTISCWSFYPQSQTNNNNPPCESYSLSPKSSTSQEDSLQSMRMSSTSLSNRRSMPHFEQPPIYQGTSGEYYVAFDTSRFVFSNDFICPNGIRVDGHYFRTSEHCYLYQKALFHGNKQLAAKILETDVNKLKQTMTSLKVTHNDKWSKMQVAAMKRSNLEKFTQNPSLRAELFRTGTATLVAAIPDDCKWGIGLQVDDPGVADMNKWRGFNLLGQVLMAVRTLLASQYNDEFQNEQTIAEKRMEKCAKRHT